MGTTLLPDGAGKYVLGVDPACPGCQEPLTALHMLLHCPNHKTQRDHLEAALHSHGLILNLSNVLGPKGAARGPVFSALAKYLLDCQITDKIYIIGGGIAANTNQLFSLVTVFFLKTV
ncbi:hypothetical protein DPMN_061672 [Dreissena polymorpha]|uniref:Uncharacterized protein n=1 Tax=Dreissena polymorpha TaxID=45954 RepID=A0A9D4HIM9_DREPO|nr:hypothetical protein DPMN_061672 [Dreissena polymorpha]